MHKALSINDILDNVFQFTDKCDDSTAILVCKSWHEPALDALWYHVARLDRLFTLLAPMTFVDPDRADIMVRKHSLIIVKRTDLVDCLEDVQPVLHLP